MGKAKQEKKQDSINRVKKDSLSHPELRYKGDVIIFANTIGETETGVLDRINTIQQLLAERWSVYNISVVKERKN